MNTSQSTDKLYFKTNSSGSASNRLKLPGPSQTHPTNDWMQYVGQKTRSPQKFGRMEISSAQRNLMYPVFTNYQKRTEEMSKMRFRHVGSDVPHLGIPLQFDDTPIPTQEYQYVS